MYERRLEARAQVSETGYLSSYYMHLLPVERAPLRPIAVRLARLARLARLLPIPIDVTGCLGNQRRLTDRLHARRYPAQERGRYVARLRRPQARAGC